MADDHPVSLNGLAWTIKAWPEFELIGAITTDALLPTLRELQPDVLVFDPTLRAVYKELEVRGRTQASAVGLRHHLID